MLRDYLDMIEALFETEDKFRQVLKRYGQKVEARLASELPANQEDVRAHPEGDTDAEKAIRYIKQADPTPQGTYTDWLLTRWIAGAYSLEDLKPISDNLRIFNNKRGQIAEKDIQRYRTPADLAAVVAPYRTVDNAVPAHFKGREAEMARDPHAEILRDDEDWLILLPKSVEASQYWGCHTGSKSVEPWCITWGIPGTAYKNHANRLDSYTQRGRYPFVFVFDKRGQQSFRDGPAFAIRLADRSPVLTPKENGPEIDAVPYLSGDLAPIMTGRFAKLVYSRYPWMQPDFWRRGDDEQVAKQIANDAERMLPMAIAHGRATPEIVRDAAWRNPEPTIRALLAMGDAGKPFLDEELLVRAFGSAGSNVASDIAWRLIKADIPLSEAVMLGMCSKDGTIYGMLKKADLNPPHEAMKVAVADLRQRHYAGHFSNMAEFLHFPVETWPLDAVRHAIQNGKISYGQIKQLSPDDQLRFMPEFIRHSATKDPKQLADIKPVDWQIASKGEVRPLIREIISSKPEAVQYLPASMVTDDDIADAMKRSGIYGPLGYLPPERITPKLVDEANDRAASHKNIETPEELAHHVRDHWASMAARATNGDRLLEKLPEQYRTPEFMDSVIDARKKAYVSYRTRDDGWMANFVQVAHKEGLPITDKMIEVMIESAVSRKSTFDSVVRLVGWERIRPEMIITALRLKALEPKKVPEDKITPQIATAMFAADPDGQQDKALLADDESLAAALRSHTGQGSTSLFSKLPRERVNELLAHAHLGRGYHERDAKKKIPAKFRSRRVYEAGVGRSFKLSEVPARWRDEAMEALAITRNPDQISEVRDPLAILNDPSNTFASKEKWWQASIERAGFTTHDGRFMPVADLPAHPLSGGWVLNIAKRPKNERFLFLSKPGTAALRFAVRRGKVIVEDHFNKDMDKTYGAALREVARDFLKDVDISNLNQFGVYQSKDGVKGEDETPRKVIEGVEWSETPHKGKRKITAWIDGKPVFTMMRDGWKITSSDTLEPLLALNHAPAMVKGLDVMSGFNHDRLRYHVRQFGIEARRGSFHLLAERKIGTVKGYSIYWSPKLREITVYGEKGLLTSAKVLKTGKVGADGVEVYGWRLNTKDQKDDSMKTLVANAIKEAVTKLVKVAHEMPST